MRITILLLLFFSCTNDQVKKNAVSEKPNMLVVDNCGLEMSYFQRPKKVICIGQHTTELLIALGLKQSIVGWAFPDSYPKPDIHVISEQYPPKEVFLLSNPDFVYSGYKGAFTQEQIGTRSYLKSIGINSYLPVGRCIDKERPAVIEDLYADISNIGKIFNRQERSTSLIDSLDCELNSILHALKNVRDTVSVMVFGGSYSSGTLLVDGGYALSSDLIYKSGGKNVFYDIPKQNVEINVEEIIKRNPETIVVKSSLSDPNAQKSIEYLFRNPSLRNITAIMDSSIVVLPFTSTLPGVRNISAIKSMASSFHSSSIFDID